MSTSAGVVGEPPARHPPRRRPLSLLRTALAQPGLPSPADDTTQVMLHIDHDLLTGHTEVGRSHHANGPSVPVATARRSGGAPGWTPQHALDPLLN